MSTNTIIYRFGSFLILCLISVFTALYGSSPDPLRGAWSSASGNVQEILLFEDGYFTHSRYDLAGKAFLTARGGPYTTEGRNVSVLYEFDSVRPEEIGKRHNYVVSLRESQLSMTLVDKMQHWTRIDDSSAPLAGVWKISERLSDGKLMPVHQEGTRKTLKMLTGTRFQWFAIDPGKRSFAGTGGGTYTFKDGRYTEYIEFFSRDSSRVGASLSFEGKLQNGKWHHSGMSSRGAPIYEVWTKGHF